MTYPKQTRNLKDLSETLETYPKQTRNLKDLSETLET